MSKKENNEKKLTRINLITLGDGQVGKTSLILRYTNDYFGNNYIATIGFDYKFKNEKLKNGEEITVKIFDTAGQEKYRSLAANFLKKADGIILVYDITYKISFENLNKWLKDINENAKGLPIVLIGNKTDLEENREVSKEEGNEFAKKISEEIEFYEASCKTGENIKEAIRFLVEKIYKKYQGKNMAEESIIIKKENKNKNNKKDKKCCE